MKIKKRLLKPFEDYSWEGNTGESIVLHTTLGNTYIGAEETLKARHLSYHFVIDKDGTIYQMVETDRSAWHAGVKNEPNLRAIEFFGNGNPNRRSIGIAFVGKGYDWDTNKFMTDQQRDSAVWLIKEVGKQTGVRYNANNIFYHQEITSYKPAFVGSIREEVVRGLVGFKDEKDNVEELSRLQLILRILQLKLQILLLR